MVDRLADSSTRPSEWRKGKTGRNKAWHASNIPSYPDELLALAGTIIEKHANDTSNGGASPLSALTAVEVGKPAMDDFASVTGTANTQNTLARDHSRKAEKGRESVSRPRPRPGQDGGHARHRAVLRHGVRDLLLALNKGREKALGDWGFTVSDTPVAKPDATPGK